MVVCLCVSPVKDLVMLSYPVCSGIGSSSVSTYIYNRWTDDLSLSSSTGIVILAATLASDHWIPLPLRK